jgi:hypothetical protein
MNYRTTFPIILVPVAALTALVLAPTASATPLTQVDAHFVNAVTSQGIYATNDGPAGLVSEGHQIAMAVDRGVTQAQESNYIYQNSDASLTYPQSVFMVHASVIAYSVYWDGT